MRHPKRYCVDCAKDVHLVIRPMKDYFMYCCKRCGADVCRVGDGETNHNRKTVEGGNEQELAFRHPKASRSLANSSLAIHDPDSLSDEHILWTQDDEDAEMEKQTRLNLFKALLNQLTPRQKEVLALFEQERTTEAVAKELRISRQGVDKTLKQIRKKLIKLGCYF